MYRTAHDAVLKLFALVVHIGLVIAVLQARQPVAARLRARSHAHGRLGQRAEPVRRDLAPGRDLLHRGAVVRLGGRDPQRLRAAAEFRAGDRRRCCSGRGCWRWCCWAGWTGCGPTLAEDTPGWLGARRRYFPVLRTALTVALWVRDRVRAAAGLGFRPDRPGSAMAGWAGGCCRAVLLIGLISLVRARGLGGGERGDRPAPVRAVALGAARPRRAAAHAAAAAAQRAADHHRAAGRR